MIFGFFASNPAREARELARDAASIVEMAEQTYRPELIAEIARITRDDTRRIAAECANNSALRARELDRYKSLHREARRKNSQVGLTAYTLVIINTRAVALGEVGDAACREIDAFLQRWPGKDAGDDILAG